MESRMKTQQRRKENFKEKKNWIIQTVCVVSVVVTLLVYPSFSVVSLIRCLKSCKTGAAWLGFKADWRCGWMNNCTSPDRRNSICIQHWDRWGQFGSLNFWSVMDVSWLYASRGTELGRGLWGKRRKRMGEEKGSRRLTPKHE